MSLFISNGEKNISFSRLTFRCDWLCIVLFVAFLSSVRADVITHKYDNPEPLNPGEARFRKVEQIEPSPYLATSPLAISFAPKFEFPPEKWDVMVFRLNIFVGSHRGVYALDIGGLGNFADYKMDGIGIAGIFNSVGESDGAIHIAGIFNFAAYDFAGCQISGFFSCVESELCGLQIGALNYAGRLSGVQIGVLNRTGNGNGAQIGLINYGDGLCGIQLGLININHSSSVPFFPIMNFAF